MTASMMDYVVPRADIIGDFVRILDQSIPCLNNPLGVNGVVSSAPLARPRRWSTPSLMLWFAPVAPKPPAGCRCR
jgi:hypothetical protein